MLGSFTKVIHVLKFHVKPEASIALTLNAKVTEKTKLLKLKQELTAIALALKTESNKNSNIFVAVVKKGALPNLTPLDQPLLSAQYTLINFYM